MHKGTLFVQIGKIRLRGLSRLLVEGSAPKPLLNAHSVRQRILRMLMFLQKVNMFWSVS